MASPRRRLLWLLLVPVIAGVGWYLLRGRGEDVQYTTGTVDRGDVVEVVGATGTLEAVTTVQIGSQVSGTIQSLNADFNSQVKKGDVIARLDPSILEARLGQAEASLQSARANVDRARSTVEDTRQKYQSAQELAKQQLIAETELETARANYEGAVAQLKANEAAASQALANLNQAKVDLSHTVISTPIDGVVISRNVDVGQTVAASFQAPVLFVIANDLRRMRVNASIDEADVGRVREGQDVLFHVDAFPERDFWGRVEQVRLNPTTVSNVVTYNAIVAVDNEHLLLRPGMTATVSVQVRKAENAVRIPASALRFRPEGYERPSGGSGRPGGGRAGAAAASGGGSGARGEAGTVQAAPASGAAAGGAPGAGGQASFARGQGRPGGGGGRWRGQGGGPGATGGAQAGSASPGGAGAGGPAGGGPGGGGRWGRGRPTTVFVPGPDGQPKPVEVLVGISDGQFVEVRDGLSEGTTVITGTEIPGAARTAGAGPGRTGASPSSPFQPNFQRRQR
jgi:HlyD family secretion protein